MSSFHPRNAPRWLPTVSDMEAKAARDHYMATINAFCNHFGCYRWKVVDWDHCPKHITDKEKRQRQADQQRNAFLDDPACSEY